jgi:short-subunit dehydrogenase
MNEHPHQTHFSTKQLAVVTGASSGIGLELAKQFAKNGFDLVICAEDTGIFEAAKQLGPADVTSVRADLATREGIERLYNEVRSLGRPVDALALNAGVGVSGDFSRDIPLEQDINLIRLNVISPVHLSKLMLKDMIARGKGRVLFTSSIASTMPGPYCATYAASKAFLQSFAEAIRNELKDTGVTVTSLMPGATDTHFFARAGMEDTQVGRSENKDDPAIVAKQGFEALMAGKDHVVAGSFINKVQATVAKVLTPQMAAETHRKQVEPETHAGKPDQEKKKGEAA